jgi:methionyl-tRNA formyltransferase
MLLTHGGAEEVLARLTMPEIQVVGIFVETEIVRRHGLVEKARRSIKYDGFAATGLKLFRKLGASSDGNSDLDAALDSRKNLEKMAAEAGIPFHLVANYHTPDVIDLMKSCEPELGIVYGTNIIKESVFKIPRLGSINLHQGLAPYYRGGPPIFWELYNGEPEIGLTVHFVESKVDSGDIVLQEKVSLNYDYSYGLDYESFIRDFSYQVRTRCAEMVSEAARSIALGTAQTKKQDPTLGTRYRLPVKAQKDELRRRLKQRRAAAKQVLSESKA